MSVSRHHGKWRWDFIRDGIRYRRGGYETKQEAKIAEAEAMKQVPRMNLGFKHLCEGRLKELKSKRTPKHFQENEKLLNNLIERWATLKEITRDDVESYLIEIGKQSHQKANKDLRLIKALFNHGIEREWFTYNPASKIKPHPVKVKRRYIPPLEDILNILTQATDEQRRYLLTIIYTAARVREINNLKWTDIEPDYLILYTRKARNSDVVPRHIYITDSMRKILSNTPKSSEYVFTNKRTKKNFDYRKKMMKVLCEKAEVPHFTFHCLRHFAASLLAKEHTPLTDIQKILGHQRATTTDVYLRSLGDGLVEAGKKLEAISPPEPTPKSK
jgi:integrase